MKNIIGILVMFSVLISCSNESESTQGKAVFQVLLTDAPGDYQEVLIDIDSVLYHVENDSIEGAWESLDLVNTGTYNLLDFTGGVDTLLAETILPPGRISQLRLVLGAGNKVMIDSVYMDLITPSASSSGLKLQINAELVEDEVYQIWIDFDARESIVETGNGTFNLKPVIRTYTSSGDALDL